MRDFQARVHSILAREPVEKLIPFLAADPETNLIYCEGGYVGKCYDASLMAGIDETSIRQLIGAISQDLPDDTFIQFVRMSVPDISAVLGKFAAERSVIRADMGLRDDQRSLLTSVTDAQIEHFSEAVTNEPIYTDTRVHLSTGRLILSIKIPSALVPSADDLVLANRLINAAIAAFSGAGLQIFELTPEDMLAVWRRLFFMGAPYLDRWDQDLLLRDQIFGPGDRIDEDGEFIDIEHAGESMSLAVISVKHFPEMMALPVMNYLAGDPHGIGAQIKYPSVMSTSIRVPSQSDSRTSINRRSLMINQQAYGPLLKFIPRLAFRKRGMDAMIMALEEKYRIVEVDFRVILYCHDREEAERASREFLAIADGLKFIMGRETMIHFPMFLNALPLYPSGETIGLTNRYKTMATNHAAQILPILDDWQGTGTAVTMLTTRRGRPMPLCFYDSASSYNYMISGDSGVGKSVLAQSVIWDNLSVGAACWVIEIGNSFRKFVEVFGGSHLRFAEGSDICINPFSSVVDLDEEIDILAGIVGTMVAPTNGLDDYGLAIIKGAIRAVFSSMGTKTTPTAISNYLFAQDKNDEAIRMAEMMAEFTDRGAYGAWFNGDANVDIGGRFVVLELEDLTERPALRRVVELALIQRVSREMYSRRRGQKKILFLDEAAETLKGRGMKDFVIGAYQRIRKHNGAVGIGVQDINSYASANPEVGQAILGLSANKMLLKQPSGVVDAMQRDKIMSELGDWGYDEVRGLRTLPGLYSEVFVATHSGMGVGRLVLERYRQVLFSTRGRERDWVFEKMQSGMSAADAIAAFIEMERAETASRTVGRVRRRIQALPEGATLIGATTDANEENV
jgi:conjugal transfer ATP-binding protein TraC